MSSHHQTVEHIVLIRFKPDADSTQIAAMMDEVNGLASLNLTLHLSVGKILRSTSTSNFSHIVYGRFSSTDDLQAYNQHPEHLKVLQNTQPLLDDFMIVDWISNGSRDLLKAGSVMRVSLLKLKDDLVENEEVNILERVKSEFKTSEHISVGESLSHEMAKGYTIGMIVVFPNLEAIDADADADMHKSKVKDFIESEIVVDCVIPLPPSVEH